MGGWRLGRVSHWRSRWATWGCPLRVFCLDLPLSALEPGEEHAGSWPRGGAGRLPPDCHPLPRTSLAKTTGLSWLRAQCFREWVGRGPFRFSTGDLEQLRELFVPSPVGDCYSASEDGKSLGAKNSPTRDYFPASRQFSFPP